MTTTKIDKALQTYFKQFHANVVNAVDAYIQGDDSVFWRECAYNIAISVANHAEQYPTPHNLNAVNVMAEMLTMLYTLQAYSKTHDNIVHFVLYLNVYDLSQYRLFHC